MHDFAIVALVGLALWKTVGMLIGLSGRELSSALRGAITLGLGIVTAFVLDYSLFERWNIAVASDELATALTGLMFGGMAYVCHYLIGLIEATGRQRRDEARQIETRTPRAA